MSIFAQAQQASQAPPTGLPEHGCVVPGCRLSFAAIYKPAPDLNGVPKYSVTLLIPKSIPITVIENAIRAAIAKGIKEKWNGFQPPNLVLPLRDGDMYAAQKPEKRQMYVGHWYINCKQDPEMGKPVVINERRMISTDPTEVQSGDYADVVVEFVPFNNKSQGVSAIPKVVRKTMTGERFTAGITEEQGLAAVGGVVAGPDLGKLSSLF